MQALELRRDSEQREIESMVDPTERELQSISRTRSMLLTAEQQELERTQGAAAAPAQRAPGELPERLRSFVVRLHALSAYDELHTREDHDDGEDT